VYYVYILQIKKTGRYYIGQTKDLTKRLERHSRGETKSVKNRGKFDVVYVEGCSSRSEAMRREREIKSYKGGKAFKRLLSDFGNRKARMPELAEVPRRWRGISGCKAYNSRDVSGKRSPDVMMLGLHIP
jgi:putative endonuclease